MSDPIWSSYANVSKIAEEAEALLVMTDRAISAHDFGRFHVDTEDWNDETLEDENEWFTHYFIRSYRVFERMPRLASRGMFSIAISFYRFEDEAGDKWPPGRTAKIYAGFAPTARAWDADSMYVNGAGNAPTCPQISARLWGGQGKDTWVSTWFFAVPLLAITSRADFEREVVVPSAQLLNGVTEDLAFAAASATLQGPPRE